MNMDASNGGKYALRTKSIIKRIESEKNRATAKKKEPKEKQKPPPLSKYRRKTANARERNRMKEINDAFVTLQKAIPDLPGADSEKLTKITILRLAVNYIDALAGVLDDDYTPTDIDRVRQLWCLENAHMARPEHCVRPVVKNPSSKTTPTTPGKNSKNIASGKNSSKASKPKSQQAHARVDAGKSKHLAPKTPGKRPSKPKNKPKVCKTASIATSNGAYITLKNVALQTPAHRLGRHANNEPLMMSMTVKRPRLETVSSSRPSKVPRLEPIIPLMTFNQPLLAFTPYEADVSHVPAAIPGNDIPEPLAGATPSTLHRITYTDPATIFHTSEDPPPPSSVNMAFQDLDSPVVRNDVLLEFPSRSGRHLSESSSRDSAFASEGSSPSSPLSLTEPTAVPVPLGDTSPSFSISSSSEFSGCGSTSDCESVLAPPVELGSLLGDEPFEEELDHLTSTFAEGDDTLHLFLAHSSSNFICTDIDDC